jgi:hypothetical protein
MKHILKLTALLAVLLAGGAVSLRSGDGGVHGGTRSPQGRAAFGGRPAVGGETAPGVPAFSVIASDPVAPTIAPPLSTFPLAQPEFVLNREINPRANQTGNVYFGEGGILGGVDPLLAVQAGAPAAGGNGFLTPIVNIAGQGYTNLNPPDTVGDVGLNHYVQMINHGSGSSVTIYDKSGNLVSGPTILDNLGSGNCANGLGDPVALYDQLADRWLLSEFSSGGNRLCVYISDGPNPVTSSWFAYNFQAPTFPDYPKYGVWHDAYYISTNENSPAAYALDRTKMLAGLPAASQRFVATDLAGFGFQALTPSDVDGDTAPPAGAPNYFMRHRDDEAHNPGSNNPNKDYLEIWAFDVDFAAPANSTFQKIADIAIAEIDSGLCGFFSFSCIAQPGTSVRLDPLREVIMFRLAYRNFGTHEVLVGNLATDVDGSDHAGVRWFELRKVGAGVWTLFQEGTFAPDQHSRWMGAIAMDGDGNIAVGYNFGSSTEHPSIRYAGRLSTDPPGTLPINEGILADGTASNSSNRYGDYSAMSVDPADDCTFWFTGEWNTASQWSTRIGSFKFDECGGGPAPAYWHFFPLIFQAP